MAEVTSDLHLLWPSDLIFNLQLWIGFDQRLIVRLGFRKFACPIELIASPATPNALVTARAALQDGREPPTDSRRDGGATFLLVVRSGGRVKIIVGCITAVYFCVMVGFVAALGGRFATVGIQTLNGGYVREQAISGMCHRVYAQPWNGIGIVGVHVRRGFAGYLAAVFQFPGGAGGMASYYLAVGIFQFCVGRFQGPTELAIGAGVAGIDL